MKEGIGFFRQKLQWTAAYHWSSIIFSDKIKLCLEIIKFMFGENRREALAYAVIGKQHVVCLLCFGDVLPFMEWEH